MKRLIPHHFTWMQGVTANLCVFAMIKRSGRLASLCKDKVDYALLRSTIAHNLCWLEDLGALDDTAKWAWQLLRNSFVAGG